MPTAAKSYPRILVRLVEQIDKKIGHWKILKPFYDSSVGENVEGLHLVYQDILTSRGSMARGILIGYALVIVLVLGILTDTKGFGTQCIENPLPCVAFVAISLSFSVRLSYSARKFAAAIHMVEPKQLPKPNNRLGKAAPSEYILTSVHPYTGAAQRMRFTLNEVKSIDPEAIKLEPWWRRMVYAVDPMKTNYRIRDRAFLLEPQCFKDSEFYDRLAVASKTNRAKVQKRVR